MSALVLPFLQAKRRASYIPKHPSICTRNISELITLYSVPTNCRERSGVLPRLPTVCQRDPPPSFDSVGCLFVRLLPLSGVPSDVLCFQTNKEGSACKRSEIGLASARGRRRKKEGGRCELTLFWFVGEVRTKGKSQHGGDERCAYSEGMENEPASP